MAAASGSPWSLPGYDVQELLGYGGSGEVWRAVDIATGDVVALKRLCADAAPAAAESFRREAALLRTVDSPHVVRLRAVVGEGAGAVLVLDHADGGSLAALLTRRGSLDAGEVVTVAAPLAQALAEAHARGLVHGDVTPANVLFTADGMPMLSDFGLARLVGTAGDRVEGTAEYLDPAVVAGADPAPASDVWALAAVCHHMLAGSPPHEGPSVSEVLAAAAAGGRAPLGLLAPHAPRALVEAVEAALHPDPFRRPDAAAFAGALRRSHAAAPVALRGPRAATAMPGVRPTHAVPRHAAPAPAPAQRRVPRWLVPVGVAVLLTVAAGAGWGLGRSAEPTAAAVLPAGAAASPAGAPSPSAGPLVTGASADRPAAAPPGPVAPSSSATPVEAATDWPSVLDGLDAARADAFAEADAERLSAVYAPGSPGLVADAALVRRLAADGHHATGVRHSVRSVEEREVTAAAARLLVVDTLSAYEVRDRDGTVVRRVPARGESSYTVELVRTDAGWRLVSVRPA